MSATPPPNNLRWDQGIINKVEKFIIRRHKVPPVFARACATTIVSALLKKVTLTNQIGTVNAGVFTAVIGPSGAGKTPPIERVRDYMIMFNKSYLIPERFTLEGLTERLTSQENPKNYVIVNDEMSMMVAEKGKKQFSGTLEFLSKNWDGWVFGYQTRAFKQEGGFRVKGTFLGGGTPVFLKDLDEDFWSQGLGPRYLWVYLDLLSPVMRDRDFFFTNVEGDKEWNDLQEWIASYAEILGKLESCWFMDKVAEDIWKDKDLEWRQKSHDALNPRMEEMYAKLPLQALKLAMCYAGSRISVVMGGGMGNTLLIYKEDIKRAVDDIEQWYVPGFERIEEVYEDLKTRAGDRSSETNIGDLRNMMAHAIENTDDYITREIAQRGTNITDRNKTIAILRLGATRGSLELVYDPYQDPTLDLLKPEELKKALEYSGWKRGKYPIIWRVTPEGKKEVNLLKVT